MATLLPAADVVVPAVPLTDKTFHSFVDFMLGQMSTNALLVNVSRGAVVDTEALAAHLRAGRIRAGLDVTQPEPLPPDHDRWQMPGVLVAPHVAGDTPQAEERVYRFVGDQLRPYANREPLRNVVRS
jgi:phosphoglycerate dehydrogenase-like enzyme